MDQTTSPQVVQEGQQQEGQPQDQFNVEKIQALLTAKDDTSRFVGLALLKTLLDNSEEVRQDVETVTDIWQAISPKFLDRLIKTGSQPQSRRDGEGQEMLDLAVSVLHTFVTLLPEDAIKGKRAVGRIPHLVACLEHSSEETTRLVLETLLTLVSQPEGAQEFDLIGDLAPLIEIAPSHQLVLKIIQYAWMSGMLVSSGDRAALRFKLDKTIEQLVSSFKGTDAVTLLEFLADIFHGLDPKLIPQNPSWLPSLRTFIQSLVKSRPTSAGRAAWTNLAATLLQLYPLQAPDLLFLDPSTTKGKSKASDAPDTPFSYVLISLLLVDLRATLPSLLSQLNSPSYKPISTRLSSAYTILSNFIGYLIRAADDSSPDMFTSLITPDLLLKLRESISETMSLTVEYLRDRWDASVAGALGLHPDSRTSTVHTASGSHLPLTWDSKGDAITEDPLIESAIMALAIWLREDDGEVLRLESAGLMDMYLELYRASSNSGSSKSLDFRRPILAALEGTLLASLTSENTTGLEAFLSNSGWDVLSSDLISILQAPSSPSSSPSQLAEGPACEYAARGLEIIRVLLPIAEHEQPGPREGWLDLVTHIAAVYIAPPPPPSSSPSSPGVTTVIQEFHIGALQLATSLLERSPPAVVRKRYRHTMASLLGLAEQVNAWLLRIISGGKGRGDGGGDDDSSSLFEALDEVRMAVGVLQGWL